MPDIPFTYGTVVRRTNFVNRKEDIQRLQQNFRSGTNTILISPRRWGKSSLVHRATSLLTSREKQYQACFLDLYSVRSEEEFYRALAEAVINSTNNKLQEALAAIKNTFGALVPKLSVSTDPGSEISVSMDWKEIVKKPGAILNLAEHIATKKKIRLLVCLDEFQNIGSFTNSLDFQKKLRAHWQHHRRVSYCLYGSRRHMMIELFSDASMPFYKFGDLFFLDKIKTRDWSSYIQREFSKTNKSISADVASTIADSADNHSYYVQQLAQLCWLRTKKKCDYQIVERALEALILQLSLIFQQLTDTLSNRQVNLLHALVNGEENLSSIKNINKYRLGTSGTVSKSKKALEEKQILDLVGDELTFNDPIYFLWLKSKYFKSKPIDD